jgi:hypothetical protein
MHTGGAAEAKLPTATFATAEHTPSIRNEGHVLLAKSDGDDNMAGQARTQAADRHVVNAPRKQFTTACSPLEEERSMERKVFG